ncbi:MAG TPA: aldo/keto reductase [Candidatus Limnocylindria bacterium]|nr:aldo/keto reductase [Candidatus Limnocylindria bacterium]
MDYTTLGKTGLKVSVAGLGCGGPSRLGMRGDVGAEDHAVRLIRQALDLGVNFLDTAQNYGTEGVVGKAIAGVARDRVVISTKKTLPTPDDADPAAAIVQGLEKSLKLLGTDYIDIYHLHGVEPKDYEFAQNQLIEPMRRLQQQGKIRFVGVTEGFVVDTTHTMLADSLKKELWDVVMVGFSLLNPSARKHVFPLTQKSGVGVLDMFAVRRALSQPQRLKEMCAELVEKGAIEKTALDLDDPLGFLLKETDAATLPEAAYRFCRHERGVDVVLTGTGNADHLKENIAAILKAPLPQASLEKLARLFGGLDYLTGN